jgi:hypothetical protein
LIKTGIRVLLFLLLLAALPLPTGAEELPLDKELQQDYQHFLDAIPPEVGELLGEEILTGDLTQSEPALRERGSISAVLSVIAKLTGLSIRENLALLARICGLLLIAATLRTLLVRSEGSLSRAFGFCSALTMLCALLLTQWDALAGLRGIFDTVQNLSVAFLPLMGKN